MWTLIALPYMYRGTGRGDALQYRYLEIPMDRGTWRATVNGVAKESDTT